jgi:methylenetetrahydrofolate dehydrogenase (NADP+) / methenyltetrahydrofolate cyclohydrolase
MSPHPRGFLLDGKALSETIQAEIAQQVNEIKQKGHKVPHLAAVLVGSDGASETYVSHKVKACERVGFASTLKRYPDTTTEQELLEAIDELNADPEIDGFIVQLPLPKHIRVDKVLERISPAKDVDGFHPMNTGRMVANLPAYRPATPDGIVEMISRFNIPTRGRHVVVIGRSLIVGTPISLLLSRDGYPGDATVTLCHRYTEGLASYTRTADILIVAVGIPGFITADMVKEGCTVIDVGITRVTDETKKSGFSLKGDVAFDEVKKKAAFITPVPGGVGPMTIASLLKNTLLAAKGAVYGK